MHSPQQPRRTPFVAITRRLGQHRFAASCSSEYRIVSGSQETPNCADRAHARSKHYLQDQDFFDSPPCSEYRAHGIEKLFVNTQKCQEKSCGRIFAWLKMGVPGDLRLYSGDFPMCEITLPSASHASFRGGGARCTTKFLFLHYLHTPPIHRCQLSVARYPLPTEACLCACLKDDRVDFGSRYQRAQPLACHQRTMMVCCLQAHPRSKLQCHEGLSRD